MRAETSDEYLRFYYKYKRFIKLGIMEDASNRRKLARLLRFNTTFSQQLWEQGGDKTAAMKPRSFDEYLEAMKPGQMDFFYIAGDPETSNITDSPFLIPFKKKGIEVIYLTEPVDELVLRDLKEYDRKIFVPVTQAERKQLNAEGEFEKEKLKQWRKRFKPLVNFMKEALDKQVERVEVSTRLAADTTTPVALAHLEGTASANMERYSRQQNRFDPRYTISESKKVLEVNPTNNLIKRLNVAVQQVEAEGIEGPDPDEDKEEAEERLKTAKQKLEAIVLLLHDTAIFESGFVITDTNEYAERVFDVLTRMTGLPDAPVVEDEEDLLVEVMKEEEEAERQLMEQERDQAEKKKKKKAEEDAAAFQEEKAESEAEEKNEADDEEKETKKEKEGKKDKKIEKDDL
jgi:HSP90 family molecular chaperone